MQKTFHRSGVVGEAGRSRIVERSHDERVLAALAGGLDRTLPVPLGVQLRGLIEFGIALGELPPGQRLPSVRELAESAGVAPMTIAAVYGDLRKSGLIDARPGAGTFVADSLGDRSRTAAMRRIQGRVDAIFAEAEQLGLPATVVAALVNARAARGRASELRPLHLVMVGNFLDATRSYADCIVEYLAPGDSITSTTVGALQAGEEFPLPCDVCVTLPHRRSEVESLAPGGLTVVSVSFIPSEETRARLAAIDPMARVGIISIFPEFMALMKPGVLRFAPHVAEVEVRLFTAPDLDVFLTSIDVAIYASGAESIIDRLPPGRQAIEYRHVPDPHSVRQVLLPVLERLRTGTTTSEEMPS